MSGACICLLKNVDFFIFIHSKNIASSCPDVSHYIAHKGLACPSFHSIPTLMRFGSFSNAGSLKFILILIVWLHIIIDFEDVLGHPFTIDNLLFFIAFELSETMKFFVDLVIVAL